MPRKKPRATPVEGELVTDPAPSPAEMVPATLPDYHIPAPPELPADTPPPGGWPRLPAGQQVNAAIMQSMQDAFPPSRVVAMLEHMATAVTETRYGKVVADWKARTDVVKILLSYGIGLPAQQMPAPPAQVKESNEQTMERLLKSPAARRALREAIVKAEAEAEPETPEKEE